MIEVREHPDGMAVQYGAYGSRALPSGEAVLCEAMWYAGEFVKRYILVLDSIAKSPKFLASKREAAQRELDALDQANDGLGWGLVSE